MKQHKKPDGDLLTQLIALILLVYLFFALFHVLLTSGVLIITEDKNSSIAEDVDTTGGSTPLTVELNPDIFDFQAG